MKIFPVQLQGRVLEVRQVTFNNNKGVSETKQKADFYISSSKEIISVNAPLSVTLTPDVQYTLSGNICVYLDKSGEIKISLTLKD